MSDAFDPKRDHRIPREKAAGLIQTFQSQTKAGEHRATTFNRSAFEHLLAQPGAAGIRIYRAQREDGSHTMVLTAVDEKGQDLATGKATEDSVFVNSGHDCPPWCIPTSWL